MEEKMIVYRFLYNPMIHESLPGTISIHRTRKGAEMAMEFHKAEALKEWNETMYWRRENYADKANGKLLENYLNSFEFARFEWWGINEIELKK